MDQQLLEFQNVTVGHSSGGKEIKTYHYVYTPVQEFEGDIPLIRLIYVNGKFYDLEFDFPAEIDKHSDEVIAAVDREVLRINEELLP